MTSDTRSEDRPLTALDRLRLHVHDPETFAFSYDDASGLVDLLDAPPKVGSGELDAAGLEIVAPAECDPNCDDPECPYSHQPLTLRQAYENALSRMKNAEAELDAMRTENRRASEALAAPVDHPEVVGELRSALANLAHEMRFLLRQNPKMDGGLYRQRLGEADAAIASSREPCIHNCDVGGICLAEHSGFPQSCPSRSGLQPSDSPALEAGVVELRDFAAWIETWVSNPVGAYSVSALDGLFGMTRDKLAALAAREASR